MKPLSETLTELGIEFTFPIEIYDAKGKVTYYQISNDCWQRWEYDDNGKVTYYEDSDGLKEGTPKSAKTCEGKVIEFDGIKYELTAL
jgi:hypothetical protein